MINLKNWFIKKLAGDRLVILNATILYKHYPLFADEKENPLVDSNQLITTNHNTPFQIYASHTFETVDDNLKLKPEYEDSYNKVIREIKEND